MAEALAARRHRPRRSRRHRAAERPADDGVVFRGGDGGNGGAAQPGYKEDEFRFFLEDTDARVLILPPDGLEEARRAAGDRVPLLPIDIDATGTVGLVGSAGRDSRYEPPASDDVALVLHTSGSTGRPKRVPLAHANLSISARQRRPQLRARTRRRGDVRDAAVPRPRARGVDARRRSRPAARW